MYVGQAVLIIIIKAAIIHNTIILGTTNINMKSCAQNIKDNTVTPTNVVDGAVGVQKTHWFVAIVNNNSERKTAQRLQDKKMNGAYECFVPVQKKTRVWRNGRKNVVDELLLPTMIFIRCTKEKQEEAKRNHYVNSFLKNSASKNTGFYDAAIIPDKQIEKFKEMLQKADRPVTIESNHFKLGDLVRVKTGALSGQVGHIIVDPHGCYLVILLNNLGFAKVQIDPTEVEKIEK